MLKRLIVNNKKIPIPIPLVTFAEAIRWIEETLVPPGYSLTRVVMDKKVLHDAELTQSDYAQKKLNERTELEVRIDSPSELAIQTLEAIRNLAGAIHVSLKPLAVEMWQARSGYRPQELDSITHDLQLILELIDSVIGLIDPSLDSAALQGTGLLLKRAMIGCQLAKANSDWKAVARALLNRVEPQLKEINKETEFLQLRILGTPLDSLKST